MSIFEQQPNQGPTAEEIATRLLRQVNNEFNRTVKAQTQAVKQFWRNDLADSPNGPTGVEVLQAMGTKAQTFLSVAYARVMMMLTIQGILGRDDLVDVAAVSAPYTFTWNEDGSLNEATPIVAPEPEPEPEPE